MIVLSLSLSIFFNKLNGKKKNRNRPLIKTSKVGKHRNGGDTEKNLSI